PVAVAIAAALQQKGNRPQPVKLCRVKISAGGKRLVLLFGAPDRIYVIQAGFQLLTSGFHGHSCHPLIRLPRGRLGNGMFTRDFVAAVLVRHALFYTHCSREAHPIHAYFLAAPASKRVALTKSLTLYCDSTSCN